MAGVGTVRAVRDRLACFVILFAVVAVGAAGTARLVHGFATRTVGVRSRLSGGRVTPLVSRQLLLSVPCRAAAVDPGAGGSGVGRIGLVTWGRVPIGGNITARQPETRFVVVAAAVGAAAADNPFPTTLPAPFAVGFEATLVLQGGAMLRQL